MVQSCMRGVDFREGVRALLVDKDQRPQWSPAALEDVHQDELIRNCFSSLGEHELALSPAEHES